MTLDAIQSRLKVLVEAEPLLAGKKVLIEEKDNLTSQLEVALAAVELAIVVAPARGNANNPQARGATGAASDEQFEVAIHRSLLETAATASTVQILDALVPRLHGALVDAAANVAGAKFRFVGHELRENGDGSYARVVTFAITHTWLTPA